MSARGGHQWSVVQIAAAECEDVFDKPIEGSESDDALPGVQAGGQGIAAGRTRRGRDCVHKNTVE